MKIAKQLKPIRSYVVILFANFLFFSCGKYAVDSNTANGLNSINTWQLASNLSFAEGEIFLDQETISNDPDPIRPEPERSAPVPGSSPGDFNSGGIAPGGTEPAPSQNSEVCTLEKVEQKIEKIENMLAYFNGIQAQGTDPGIVSPTRVSCAEDRLNFALAVLQQLHAQLQTAPATEDCRTMAKNLIEDEGLVPPSSCR